jgi:hypothetical protein
MRDTTPRFAVFTSRCEYVGPDGLPLAEACDERAAALARQAAELDAMVRAEHQRSAQAATVISKSLAELREQLAALGEALGAASTAGKESAR